LRSEGSRAIEKAVAEAQEYIQRQPIVGADETGFSQKNADGENGNNRTAWIWVAVTPLAKTVRTCCQLLKAESALWLFVRVEGLEPTNNAAERAIRPAVLWRRVSFGSQSEAGSLFVARMLTVVTSLRSQNRNVLEFMTEAILASRRGTSSPSLLPQSEPLESISVAA
jgi:hypothetical protein